MVILGWQKVTSIKEGATAETESLYKECKQRTKPNEQE